MAVTQRANGHLRGQITVGHQVYSVYWHKKHRL
jgi:hypothetical protein